MNIKNAKHFLCLHIACNDAEISTLWKYEESVLQITWDKCLDNADFIKQDDRCKDIIDSWYLANVLLENANKYTYEPVT